MAVEGDDAEDGGLARTAHKAHGEAGDDGEDGAVGEAVVPLDVELLAHEEADAVEVGSDGGDGDRDPFASGLEAMADESADTTVDDGRHPAMMQRRRRQTPYGPENDEGGPWAASVSKHDADPLQAALRMGVVASSSGRGS